VKTEAWKLLLKYGLGLGALAWVIISYWNPKGNDDPGLSGLIQQPMHFGPFFLAALITIVGLLITFFRWHLLVRAVGLEFKRSDAVRLGMIGFFFTNFLPAVGSDMFKAYFIARSQSQRTRAVATVIVDRAVGLWALAAFVAIVGGIFWLSEDPLLYGPSGNQYLQMIVRISIAVTVSSLTVFVLVGLLSERMSDQFANTLARIPKVGGSAAELWRACWIYRQRSGAVVLAVLMSLVGHMGWVLVYHLAVHAFETRTEAASLKEHMIIVPVGMTCQAMFPAPGGVGGGEAAYGELYGMLGKPKANGVAGSLSQRVIFLGLGVIGYMFYTRSRSTKSRRTEEETPAAAPPDPSLAPAVASEVRSQRTEVRS
jgi:uncharacterized membrane protein YbhN (UPF0104 family)